MPRAPTGSATDRPAQHVPAVVRATEQPMERRTALDKIQEPRLYLDYNGVLNSGNDMLEEMCRFVVAMDHLDVSFHLLSYRKTPHGMMQTLREIDDAGVLDLFDTITFTAFRTAQEREAFATEHAPRPTHHDFISQHDSSASITYETFYGGKDDYIKLHDNGALTLFVDDKYNSIAAAQWLVPHVHGYEFRRHRFFSPITACKHVRTLADLHVVIKADIPS